MKKGPTHEPYVQASNQKPLYPAGQRTGQRNFCAALHQTHPQGGRRPGRQIPERHPHRRRDPQRGHQLFPHLSGQRAGGVFRPGPGACRGAVPEPPVLKRKGPGPGHWPQRGGLRPETGRGRRPQPPVSESVGPGPESRNVLQKVPVPQGRDGAHGGAARCDAGHHHLGKTLEINHEISASGNFVCNSVMKGKKSRWAVGSPPNRAKCNFF